MDNGDELENSLWFDKKYFIIIQGKMPKTREEELWPNTFTLEKRNSDKILHIIK